MYTLPAKREGKYKGFSGAIELEAYLIAESDGFRKNKDEYYFQAERNLLNETNISVNKQSDLIKRLNRVFFEQLDIHQCNEDIAKDYLFFCYENQWLLEKVVKDFSNNKSNIAIATANSNLDFISKRTMLISDFPIIGFSGDTFEKFEYAQPQFDAYDYGHGYRYESNCPDLYQLGDWLRACRPLLNEGILTYLPTIRITHEAWWSAGIGEQNISENLIFDASINNRNVSFLKELDLKKSRLIKTIAELEIPVIDNVSTYDWASVTTDEYSVFLRFKELITSKLLDIIAKENSFQYGLEIEKAGLSISKEFGLLTQDLKRHKIKSTICNIGGIIGLITATLIAVDVKIFENADKIIGTTGTLANLLNYYNQFNELKVKKDSSEYLYLFLLNKKMKY